jgi:hypothetical protein
VCFVLRKIVVNIKYFLFDQKSLFDFHKMIFISKSGKSFSKFKYLILKLINLVGRLQGMFLDPLILS